MTSLKLARAVLRGTAAFTLAASLMSASALGESPARSGVAASAVDAVTSRAPHAVAHHAIKRTECNTESWLARGVSSLSRAETAN